MNVLITGASSGIGKALTIELINQGHSVWGLARRKGILESLAKEFGKKFLYSVCDVSNPRQVNLAVNEMTKKKFIPRVVVLNAAANLDDRSKGFNFDNFEKTFATNVNGVVLFTHLFMQLMKNSNVQFVAISSTARYRPGSTSIAYSASKAALSNVFRGFRANFASKKLVFSTINFGPIKTEMWTGPNLPGTPTAKQAAKLIIKIIGKNKSRSYYYPLHYTLITRASTILPDNIFRKLYNMGKRR